MITVSAFRIGDFSMQMIGRFFLKDKHLLNRVINIMTKSLIVSLS